MRLAFKYSGPIAPDDLRTNITARAALAGEVALQFNDLTLSLKELTPHALLYTWSGPSRPTYEIFYSSSIVTLHKPPTGSPAQVGVEDPSRRETRKNTSSLSRLSYMRLAPWGDGEPIGCEFYFRSALTQARLLYH